MEKASLSEWGLPMTSESHTTMVSAEGLDAAKKAILQAIADSGVEL